MQNILWSNALQRKDKGLGEDVDKFEKFIAAEWSYHVSHHSLSDLSTKKLIKLICCHLQKISRNSWKVSLQLMSSNAEILEQHLQLEVWSELALATLVRLVLFNKRRGGGAPKMLVKSYHAFFKLLAIILIEKAHEKCPFKDVLQCRIPWRASSVGLLVEKYGEKHYSLVTQKRRDLAWLLLQLRKTDSNPAPQLPDLIMPGRFDDVVNAIKNIAKFHFDQGVQNVATPSLSWKIGHSLNKCINILQGHALWRNDKDLEDVDDFEKLVDAEWSYRVLHHSLSALSTKKFNKVDLFPLVENLFKSAKIYNTCLQEKYSACFSNKQTFGWSFVNEKKR